MQKAVLKNGLKVLYHHKQGNAVVIQVMVHVGSNRETPKERGISHFLEHILFEGTIKRPTNELISNEIEKIGGEFNAYTANERTCFYIKVLQKHFGKAVEILSDILHNSLFDEDHIKKEKRIVLKEIDMVYDEPTYYQWILLQQSLFSKHPCRVPTYGDRKVIANLTRQQVIDYFEKYYLSNNMTVSIVGDVKQWKQKIAKNFTLPQGKVPARKRIVEPAAKRNVVKREKRKTLNTYSILGFKTVPRNHPDSPVLEVINGILGRGQSGKIFIEVRSKRGLAYEVGTQNVAEINYGYFAVYSTVAKAKVRLVRDLVLKEIGKLSAVTEQEVKEAKTFIEGSFLLGMDDAQKLADQLLFWSQVEDAALMTKFLARIKKVTVADVKRVVKKYFKNYTHVVIEGK